MFHVQRPFESSLRGGLDKSKLNLQHKACRGTSHGTGNYCKTNSNQPCEHGKKGPLQLSNGSLGSKTKSSSVSSENFSESDSVDSAGEKSSKASETVDEINQKNLAVSDRLYSASTKASHAKTAKMRYLDEADDDDILWIEDLMNGADATKAEGRDDKEKRFRRREVMKKVMGGNQNGSTPSPKPEEVSPFSRSSSARSSFSRGSFRRTPTPKNQPTPPPRANLRGSFRKSIRKKLKIPTVTYDELLFKANNRKVSCFSDDKSNCFKDLQSVLREQVTQWLGVSPLIPTCANGGNNDFCKVS